MVFGLRSSMLAFFAFSLSVLVLYPGAGAKGVRRAPATLRPAPRIPIVERPTYTPINPSGAALPPLDTWYYFDQLIDHTNPSLGTFQQRYYFNSEFYEPGGPIGTFISTPGEDSADGYTAYLTNFTIFGQFAQALKGATIVIEHRFFGTSNPYPDLTEKSFQYFTLDQSVADLAYFAQNAVLPIPGGDALKAPNQAPWILVGGSYSGALVSWVLDKHPGVYWSGYASSAVVEAITYYWSYFEPIRQNMPKNCTADVEAAIDHIDKTFTTGSTAQINALKAQFGMQNVTHLDDVAAALRAPFWVWQDLQPFISAAPFYVFCDALEVWNGTAATADGWGLEHALEAWGSYMVSYLANECGSEVNDDCLGTYDSTLSYYHDTSIDNPDRSWEWLCCKYVGWWQDGAPENLPRIVSSLVDPAYDNRQCSYWFPETFPSGYASPNNALVNDDFTGWDVNATRLFFANGQRDPWREATVSSDFHTRQSTAWQPIAVGDGWHCSDLLANSSVDPTVAKVQNSALAYLGKWHAEWHATVGGGKRVLDDELVEGMDAIIRANGMPVD